MSALHFSTFTRSSSGGGGYIPRYKSTENAVQICVHRVKSTILSIKHESIKIVFFFHVSLTVHHELTIH